MHRFQGALVAFMLLASCGPAHGPASRPASPSVPAALVDRLTLPPERGTGAALAELAKGETCQAAWLQARYLLDLFDWVRLSESRDTTEGKTDEALKLLWTVCGRSGTPSRGRLATDEVMTSLKQHLERAVDRCARDPLEVHAREGLELLSADRSGRRSVKQALEVVVVYRRIAHSSSPLAPNAVVRLVDWCAKAFRLAAGGDPNRQHQRLNHCLFPLFPAHPGPYFEDNPALRPPDPPWTVLQTALAEARAGLEGTRLEALGTRLKRDDERFFSVAGAKLPTPLRMDRFDLPRLTTGAQPWDRTPVVVIGDKGYLVGGRAVLADDVEALERAIAARLHNDGRRSITVVANRSSPADRVLEVGRAARRAGALTMWLGVARKVRDRPVAGDVQAKVFGDKPVLRLEGIPVSLRELGATRSGVSRSLPRALGYDPRTAQGHISLLVTRDGVHVSSRDGRMTQAVRVKDLSHRLLELRQLYPGDRSVLLAPGRVTTYEDLEAVATATRHHKGQPLMPGIALAKASQLASSEKDLAPVIRLLGRADVEMTPRVNRAWPDLAFRCYLDVLRDFVEKKNARPPEGTLQVRITRKGPRAGKGTLRNRKLSRCVERSLGKAPKLPEKLKRITLSFSLKG